MRTIRPPRIAKSGASDAPATRFAITKFISANRKKPIAAARNSNQRNARMRPKIWGYFTSCTNHK
jgi:hypothetical protein